MNREIPIENILKKHVQELITKEVEEEIEKQIEEFKAQLLYRKDKYIAEILKGITILHEKNMYGYDYKVIFENVVRIEK